MTKLTETQLDLLDQMRNHDVFIERIDWTDYDRRKRKTVNHTSYRTYQKGLSYVFHDYPIRPGTVDALLRAGLIERQSADSPFYRLTKEGKGAPKPGVTTVVLDYSKRGNERADVAAPTEEAEKPMTDAELIAICGRIDRLNTQIIDLVYSIQDSTHPNGYKCGQDIADQCSQLAWARHIVHSYLEHPEEWETGDYGIRRKKGSAPGS